MPALKSGVNSLFDAQLTLWNSLILTISATLIYLAFCAAYNLFWSPLAKVPGSWVNAISEWPLIIQSLKGRRAYYVHDLHLKYGPSVRVAPNLVSITDHNLFQHVYGKLKKGDFYKGAEVISGVNHSMSTIEGKIHQPIRKVVAGTYTAQNVNGFEQELTNNIRAMLKRIDEDGAQGATPVDILHLTKLLSADAVGFVAFGQHFNSVINGHSQFTGWLDEFSIFMAIKATMPKPVFFLIRNFPLQSIQHIMGVYKRFKDFSVSLFEPIKARLSAQPDALEQEGTTLVARMLSIPLTNTGKRMTDDQIACELTGNMYAGSDTTAFTSSSCLWALTQNPACLARLREELDQALGPEPVGNMSVLKSLPYLDAVVHEALRVYGAAPSHLPRVVDEQGLIIENGVFLPPGTDVAAQSYTVHRKPEIFPDPNRFNPERWLNISPEQKSLMLSNFMPFGVGPRICAGQVLAWFDLRLIISAVAKRYNMSPAFEGQDIHAMTEEHFVCVVPKGIKLRFTPRKDA